MSELLTDPSAAALADAAARTRIDHDEHEPLVVEAGAGSGKTTHLVRRVAASLAAGVAPDEIVVITFTDKAARELVHRLRQAVDVSLEDAFIGTIHGFCVGILRQFPIEAGLPPAFHTADEITSGGLASMRHRAAVRSVYDRSLTDPAVAQALGAVLGSGAGGSIEALAELLDQRWDQLGALPLAVHDPADLDGAFGDLRDPVVALASHSWVACSDDKLAVGVRDAARWLQSAATLAQRARVDNQPKPNHGRSKDWLAHTGRDVTEVRQLCRDALARTTAIAIDAALRTLTAVLAPVVVQHAGARLASGELGFDDLLLLTRRLLSDNAEVRQQLRARYRRIFVDEFQDTDPVQFEIISALTDRESTDGPVLFAVGDPKQSIYAFRQADVGLFRQLADRAESEERRVDLVTNFRTRPAVADWINEVVGRRFAGHGHQLQAPFVALEAHRGQLASSGPPIVVLGLESGDEADPVPVFHERAALACEAEAADVVAAIRAAHGSWLVDDEPARPASLGDIAVLIRTRAGLGQLEVALRAAEIAYRVEGGTLVYESREVYELLRVLRAVDDPSDGLALVTALRTSIFGLSDLDLYRYRHEGLGGGRPRPWRVPTHSSSGDFGGSTGRWHEVAEPSSPEIHRSVGAVAEVLSAIGRLSRRRHERAPAELLASLYDSYLGAVAARFEGAHLAAETWRRVRFVIDEARAWSDATAGTLRDYLAWVDARVSDVERSEVAPDEHEDSVRILTIHSAKGLEFPIVIVAGLGRRDMGTATRAMRITGSHYELKVRRLATAGYASVELDEAKIADQAEEARLLYVATTRARDHLVVSVHSSVTSRPNAAERFASCLRGSGFVALAAEPSAVEAVINGELLTSSVDDEGPRSALELPARPDPRARDVWTPSTVAKVLGDRWGPSTSPDRVVPPAELRDSPTAADWPSYRSDDDGSDDDGSDDDGSDDDLAPLVQPARPGLPSPGQAALSDPADTASTDARSPSPTRPEVPDVADPDPTDAGHRKDPAPSMQATVTRGRYGTQVGSAVHEVMQRVALDDPRRGLEQLVLAAADHNDLPAGEPTDRVSRLVASILASDAFRRYARAKSKRREMYVGAVDGDGAAQLTVWGYVDAVLSNADGTLTLLDYKTDTAFTTTDELAERYRAQLSAYAFALTKATGRPVTEAKLVVARPDGRPAHEVDVDLIAAADLLAQLRTVSSIGHAGPSAADTGPVVPDR